MTADMLHKPVISSFMTYNRFYDKSNMTGATGVAGTDYTSGALVSSIFSFSNHCKESQWNPYIGSKEVII
jgi:hypothetical protein